MEAVEDTLYQNEDKHPADIGRQARRWKHIVGNKLRVDGVFRGYRRRVYIDLSQDDETQRINIMRAFKSWQKELKMPSVREQYNLDAE